MADGKSTDDAPPTGEFGDLLEPIPAPHIFCDGIGPISIEDGLIHVTFWAKQQKLGEPGYDRVVVGRCTSQVTNAHQSIAAVGRALAESMVNIIKNRVS